jgi:hypothetical protein
MIHYLVTAFSSSDSFRHNGIFEVMIHYLVLANYVCDSFPQYDIWTTRLPVGETFPLPGIRRLRGLLHCFEVNEGFDHMSMPHMFHHVGRRCIRSVVIVECSGVEV